MIPCFPCRTAISFFFCLLFLFASAKKPDENDDSMLSLPNGNLSLAYFSFFSKKNQTKREFHTFSAERQSLFLCLLFSKNQMKKRIPYFSLPNGNLFFLAYFFMKKPNEKENSISSAERQSLFLLPTFPFSAKRNQMKKMIPCFPCRTAISFFFCLLFFFQQKEK